jgi:hypothetical protein
MPDSNTSVGSDASVVTPGQPVQPPAPGQPALAVQNPMEMSAPMPQDAAVASDPIELTMPSEQPTHTFEHASPLAPFAPPANGQPEVEYVSTAALEGTPLNAIPTEGMPGVQPRPAMSQKPVINPIMGAPVIDTAGAPPLQPFNDSLVASTEPEPEVAPPALQAAAPPEQAMPQQAPQTASVAPSPAVVAPTIQPAAPEVTAAPIMPPASPQRLAMRYSHNTQAVWKSNRRNKVLYVFGIFAVLTILGIVLVYWIAIGAPTNLQDIPLLRPLITS